MKCNIDLHKSNGHGGISSYIRNIATNLSQNDNIEFNGCSFWYKKIRRDHFKWFNGRLHLSVMPGKIVYSSKHEFPISYEFLMNSSADINIFFTYLLPNVKFNAPIVSTIHDIILLKTKCESQRLVDEHSRILERTVRLSEYILTVSEASRQDLINYFGINPDKIFIIHNGIDQGAFGRNYTTEQIDRIKVKYNLPKNYILNLGRYRKHKNIERLIESYASLPKQFRQQVKLVLSESHPDITKLIANNSLEDDIRIIGFISEEDKPLIFKLASLTYYASLYEGFGVPIIESQAAGTPVLTSNISSLPEAAGGAALLVDPYDIKDIASAIELFFTDKQLREELVIKGLENSNQYTWSNSVLEFNNFLNSIRI